MDSFPYYETTIRIDHPQTGEVGDVAIHVKRFTLEEAACFKREHYRAGNPPSAALVARQPDGPEQETTTVRGREIFILSDDVIRARRLAEMTPEARARFYQLEEEEEAFSSRFLAHTIRTYVRIAPEQSLRDDAGRPIETGEDILRVFGGCYQVLWELLQEVWSQNRLTPSAKKVWRSRFASARSSDARQPAAAGPTPAPTADAAGPAASVETEDAAAQEKSQSSSSSSAPVMATVESLH